MSADHIATVRENAQLIQDIGGPTASRAAFDILAALDALAADLEQARAGKMIALSAFKAAEARVEQLEAERGLCANCRGIVPGGGCDCGAPRCELNGCQDRSNSGGEE